MTASTRAFKLLAGSGTLVVLDVETCPSDDGDRIVAIAAATCRQGRQRAMWSRIVNPGVPITNSQFHGLTDVDVVAAPTFEQVVTELNQHLASPDTYLVCHNASYDVGVLHLEYLRLGTGARLPEVPVLDTMRLPRTLGYAMPGYSRRLSSMCAHFGVTNRTPHQAASDAGATAEVLHALLRVAAAGGHIDLAVLHAEAGTTTGTIPARPAERARTPDEQIPLPEAHLATHATLLGPTAGAAELEDWITGAVSCAELRCHLLSAKARTAQRHASVLHERLTKVLAARAATFEPGQGATLVGALNALARVGVARGKTTRPYTTWWNKNQQHLTHLARCVGTGRCPDCVRGEPCPIDVAHQSLTEAICCDPDGAIDQDRRKKIAGSDGTALLNNWPANGWHALAGYAAWLAADAWLADKNPLRADRVIDHAMDSGAHDPRIIRLYAQRLTLQRRDAEVEDLVQAHLARRTTDPGWAELASWHERHKARLAQRQRPRPRTSGDSPQQVRPISRRRPNPYAIERA